MVQQRGISFARIPNTLTTTGAPVTQAPGVGQSPTAPPAPQGQAGPPPSQEGVEVTGELWTTTEPPALLWTFTPDAPLVLPQDLYAVIPEDRRAKFTFAVWDLICHYASPLEEPTR